MFHRQCVSPTCPSFLSDQGYVFNLDEGRCTCPADEAFIQSEGMCVSTICPEGDGNEFNYISGRCVCSEGYDYSDHYDECVSTLCSRDLRRQGYEYNYDEGLCTCPAGEVYSNSSERCVSPTCSSDLIDQGYVFNLDEGHCTCPEDEFWSSYYPTEIYGGQCVSTDCRTRKGLSFNYDEGLCTCSEGMAYSTDEERCVSTDCSLNQFFEYETEYTGRCTCPQGEMIIYNMNGRTRGCSPVCSFNKWGSDSGQRLDSGGNCVCPEGEALHPFFKDCVSTYCPQHSNPNTTFNYELGRCACLPGYSHHDGSCRPIF